MCVCICVCLCLCLCLPVSVCVCLCLCVKNEPRLTQEDDVHAGIRLHRVLDRRKCIQTSSALTLIRPHDHSSSFSRQASVWDQRPLGTTHNALGLKPRPIPKGACLSGSGSLQNFGSLDINSTDAFLPIPFTRQMESPMVNTIWMCALRLSVCPSELSRIGGVIVPLPQTMNSDRN